VSLFRSGLRRFSGMDMPLLPGVDKKKAFLEYGKNRGEVS
jgi:hypothetical protein